MVSDGDDLPRPATVVRFVGFNKMGKDGDDRILGPLPSAFRQREDEDCLSVTWREYYSASPNNQLRCAIEAIRSSMTVGPLACFCIADIDDVFAVIAKHGRAGRAVYLPEDNNPAHAGIYGISPEEVILHEELAANTWAHFLTKEMADSLPLADCVKSTEVD